MEIANARVLQPHLAPDQLFVGVNMGATYSAPTPIGAKVSATARYPRWDGKLYEFEVSALAHPVSKFPLLFYTMKIIL